MQKVPSQIFTTGIRTFVKKHRTYPHPAIDSFVVGCILISIGKEYIENRLKIEVFTREDSPTGGF